MSKTIVIIALCFALATTDLSDWRLNNSSSDLALGVIWILLTGFWTVTLYREYTARPL